MDAKTSTLIAQFESARSRLDEVVDRIAPQTEIYPTWQLKQLLDHITGWDELVSNILVAHQRGESLPQDARNITQFNERSIAARSGLSLEQSRKDYDSSRVKVLTQLKDLPDALIATKFTAPWGGEWTISRTLRLFTAHEREHAEQIEKLLEGSKPSG